MRPSWWEAFKADCRDDAPIFMSVALGVFIVAAVVFILGRYAAREEVYVPGVEARVLGVTVSPGQTSGGIQPGSAERAPEPEEPKKEGGDHGDSRSPELPTDASGLVVGEPPSSLGSPAPPPSNSPPTTEPGAGGTPGNGTPSPEPPPSPTHTPSPNPSPGPSQSPTPTHTPQPSPSPTGEPSSSPTDEPSPTPTDEPSPTPTDEPSPTGPTGPEPTGPTGPGTGPTGGSGGPTG